MKAALEKRIVEVEETIYSLEAKLEIEQEILAYLQVKAISNSLSNLSVRRIKESPLMMRIIEEKL